MKTRRLSFALFETEGVGEQFRVVVENKEAIRTKCREAGLKIVNFVAVLPDLVSVDETKRKTAIADFKSGCEAARFLGADMVELDTYYPPFYVTKPYDISRDLG